MIPHRPSDRRAQMPFAMIAVLLVVVGGSSVTIIGLIEGSGGSAEAIGDDLEGMQQAFATVQRLVEDGALSVLSDVSSRSAMGNLEDVQSAFQEGMVLWLEHYFPLRVGANMVTVLEHDLVLDIKHLSLLDGDDYSRSLPLYPMVSGSYRLQVSSEKGGMERSLDLDRCGISPLPFLMDRMEGMALDLEGSRSLFTQLLSHQLSLLAQNRALRGYGMNSIGGDTGSSALLTEKDVHMAIDNALAVLEAINFRAVASDDPLLSSLPQQQNVDPASLMLQREWGGHLELSSVMSQTLASLTDRLILQWLDYLHIVDVVNLYEAINDGVVNFLEGMFNEIVGSQGSAAVKYVQERMQEAGYAEWSYRRMYNNQNNLVINLPSVEGYMQHEDTSQVMTLPGAVLVATLPAVDVFQWPGWKNFNAEYRQQTNELVQYLRSFLMGICDAVAKTYGLGAIDINLNPFSGQSAGEVILNAVKQALLEDKEWMRQVVGNAIDAARTLDQLGEAMAAFVESNWVSMYRVCDSQSSAVLSVEAYYRQAMLASYGTKYSFTEQQWQENLIDLLQSNGVYSLVQTQIKGDAEWRKDNMVRVLSTVEGSNNPLQMAIAQVARWGADSLPGLDSLILLQMERLVNGMSSSQSLEGGQPVLELPGSTHYVLYDPDGRAFLQSLVVERSTDLHVKVLGFAGRDRNTHHTGFDALTFSPYSCVVEVEVVGSVTHSVSSRNDAMSLWSMASNHSHQSILSTKLQIPVLSAWPMMGVDYRPTNTLGGDMSKLLMSFADHLLSPLTEAFRAADGAFASLGRLMMEASGFATEAMTALSNAILGPLVVLREELGERVGQFLALLGDAVMNMGVLGFSIDLHGMELRFETNIFDIAMSMTKNILKISLGASVGDTLFTVTLRLMQSTSKEVVPLLGASMATDRWTANLVIDPFMKVYRHFAELRGHLGGHGFEIFLPQVTQYQTFRVALSQVAGIGTMLSNIPLPMPGLKGSIDAGFDVKYNLPFAGNVVINEVEKNPPGVDTGNEWVELYNPLDRDVRLSGWTITSGQAGKVHLIGDVTLAAGGRMIVRFPGQFLNNGGGTNIPQGECAKLWDAQGRLIDSSPWRSDYYNDGRTWQREYDGSDRWVFKENTMGFSNGKASPGISSQQWLQKQITNAFMQAFAEYGNNMYDLDGVANVLKRTVDIVAARIIDTVAEALVESSFFIRIGVSDISSAAHGGVEMSVVVGADFVREGLRWIFDSMMQIVRNVGNPAELAHPAFLTEHVHLRLAVFTAAGPPKFLTLLQEGMTVELQAMVQCNLASLAGVLGLPAGNASMGFGVVLRGVPGAALPSFFAVDNEKQADIWLMKGRIDFSSNAL